MIDKLFNLDNMQYETNDRFDLIYCDYIYPNLNFSFVDKFWNYLKPNSIFIAQTDDSTMAEMKLKLKFMPDAFFINTCIMIQEWGGTPRKGFPKKHDYIHIFSNGENFKWYKDRIQIEKVTKGTNFDKKGTGLKTPCDVFYDLGNFSTVSKERVKNNSGHNIQWQKKLSLMNRLCLPFTDEGDNILDPFMGSASLGEWAILNNRNYIGIENDKEVFDIAKKRLDAIKT
jgi:DNA modification methylase